METGEASSSKRRKIFAVGAITFISIFIIGTYIISLSTFVVPQEASAYVPPFFENKKPVAVVGSDQTIFVGHTLNFDGTESYDPDGSITNYRWNFGDFTPSESGAQVSHVYMRAGVYEVTLMVRDNSNQYNSDKLYVTVIKPSNYARKGVDLKVEPNRTDYLIDALEKTNTTIKINSMKTLTVSIIPYSENPHVETPLPENCLVDIVDIVFSDPEAVIWPIYVERGYSNSDVIGLDESKFGIYYYMNNSWSRCRDTGVYVDSNIVWANMYEDEATGSLTILGEIPRPAEFTVTQLELNPLEVEPGENVTASIVVKNIGDESGNFNLTVNVNDETEYVKFLELEGAELQEVFFDIKREIEGVYTVEAGDLSIKFVVELLTPNFSVIALNVDPVEAKVGEDVNVQVEIENNGDKDGNYTAILNKDDVPFDSKQVAIMKGRSELVEFTISFKQGGEHEVSVESTYKTITVIPLEPARFRVSTIALNPSEIEPGDDISVIVTIINEGEVTADYDIDLKLDDVPFDSIQVSSLAGGESEMVEFTITSEDEGPHTVSVDDKSESFTVARIRKPFPWFWVIDAVVIIAIVAVVYYLRMRGII